MPDIDHERSPLLQPRDDRRLSKLVRQDEEASSMIKSHFSIEEQKLADNPVGERLPYNDYTTIDFMHDLVSRDYGASCVRADSISR